MLNTGTTTAHPDGQPDASAPAGEDGQKNSMLLVAEPILGLAEKDALCDVIASGWITMGERVRAFERAFAAIHGADDAVAVNSCTAALHLILEALGIGPGDEVLVPSLTFVATANSVLYVGAKPVFVDVAALDTPLMSVDEAEALVTPRTRAIILMHYAGYLSEGLEWRSLADRHNLLIIEDSAHAVGIAGIGRYSDATAFSFYGNKNMTTAEGGMVLARDPKVLARIRQMRGHGMTLDARQRLNGRTPHYDVTMLGFNYRMDELRAAVGLVQLERLAAWNAKRKALTEIYRQLLALLCPDVLAPFSGERESANHIMPVLLPPDVDRDDVVASLIQAGIQTTIHYPPVHMLSYYANAFPGARLPVTEAYAARELSLPLHPAMTPEQIKRVAVALADAFEMR